MTKATVSNEKVLAGLMVKVMQGDQGALVQLAKLQGMTIPVSSEGEAESVNIPKAEKVKAIMTAYDLEKAKAEGLLEKAPDSHNIRVEVKGDDVHLIINTKSRDGKTGAGKQRLYYNGKAPVYARVGDEDIKFYVSTASIV